MYYADRLMELPSGVLGVAQVGNTLRVLTGADGATPDMTRALAAAGQEAGLAAAPPNLEDVFVAATRKGDDDEERAA